MLRNGRWQMMAEPELTKNERIFVQSTKFALGQLSFGSFLLIFYFVTK